LTPRLQIHLRNNSRQPALCVRAHLALAACEPCASRRVTTSSVDAFLRRVFAVVAVRRPAAVLLVMLLLVQLRFAVAAAAATTAAAAGGTE
jgi:hypothetical protein